MVEEGGDNFFFGDKVSQSVKLSSYLSNPEVQTARGYPHALYTPP
jgi:hypothetical protein